MNFHAVQAIYRFELSRTWRTLFQSIATPVMTTSLYFVVFGSAIGSRMMNIDGVSYGAFIVPGLIMLTVLMESVSNGSFGIYMPKFAGTIYELLSAPVGLTETLLGYTGAAATKSVILGVVILVTARLFVPFSIEHPFWMIAFLVLTSVTFALLGFLIGIWADSWEKIQIVPMMVVTPLTFLGGSFYSISMLPPIWQKITLFNPVVYLVNGFRWSFYGKSDVNVVLSFGMTLGVLPAVPGRGELDVPHGLQAEELARLSLRARARRGDAPATNRRSWFLRMPCAGPCRRVSVCRTARWTARPLAQRSR